MVVGGVLGPAALVCLFNVPSLERAATIGMTLAGLVMFATAYTLWNVPYLALTAEATDDYHQRSTLNAYRIYGIAAGNVAGSSCGPWLLSLLGGGRGGYGGMAFVIGGIALASFIGCVVLLRGARMTTPPAGRKHSTAAMVASVRTNAPFCILAAMKVLFFFSIAQGGAISAFFFRYVLHRSDFYLGLMFLAATVGNVISMPAWLWAARRISKKVIIIGLAGYGLIQLSWLFAGPGEAVQAVLLRGLLMGLATGGVTLLAYSMLLDTIALDNALTGDRREGAFSGLVSLVEKGAGALGLVFAGTWLTAIGYTPATDHPPGQLAGIVSGLYVAFAIVPALAGLGGSALMAFYNLSSQRLGSVRMHASHHTDCPAPNG